MSLLPQRKKSAEEIAKLRESLGIPGQEPAESRPPNAEVGEEAKGDGPLEIPAEPEVIALAVSEQESFPELTKLELPKSPANDREEEPVAIVPLTPLPKVAESEGKPVRSLKRSERIPVLPVDEEPGPEAPVRLRARLPAATLPTLQVTKQVKSLRKSEQLPLPAVQPPPADSSLPSHRRSDKELGEIRRREALSSLSSQVPPRSMSAHLALVIPGYVFAAVAAAGFYYYDFSWWITAACVAIALIVAGLIYFRWPLSRHHAAFIAVMSLLVIVFGALHYFPQLTHGT